MTDNIDKSVLLGYIHNQNSDIHNFNLGLEYEKIKQVAGAVSYYLRAAELSSDPKLQYEALIRCSHCFDVQGGRDHTVKSLLQGAIDILPNRPEAYFFMSKKHQLLYEWQQSYMYASVGYDFCNFDLEPLSIIDDYPGRYGLLFQKGVAAWWVGRHTEARTVLYDLKRNYTINDSGIAYAINASLDSIGHPTNIIHYNSQLFELRYPFNNSANIAHNFSQVLQDIFVLTATEGKRNGTYLEIGCAEPFYNNNTALLEKDFGWKGISIDVDHQCITDFFKQRNNIALCADALTIDFEELLHSFAFPKTIDYLQLDCDPPSITLDILKKIPFDTYTFGVITFEHDYYRDTSTRQVSRDLLLSKGYKLIVSDVAFNDNDVFEDWWIHPSLVDENKIISIQNTSGISDVKKILLKDAITA